MTESLIKRTRFFAVQNNFEVAEFVSFSEALFSPDKQFVVMDEFREFYRPCGGDDWRISQYKIYSSDGKEIEISSNGWKIRSIEISYRSSTTVRFEIVITDPNQHYLRVKDEFRVNSQSTDTIAHNIETILRVQKQLFEYSRFDNWQKYELNAENLRLRNELTEIKKSLKVV